MYSLCWALEMGRFCSVWHLSQCAGFGKTAHLEFWAVEPAECNRGKARGGLPGRVLGRGLLQAPILPCPSSADLEVTLSLAS